MVEFDVEAIRARAVELGVSNVELAEKAGLCTHTVGSALNGRSVRRHTMARIVNALKLEPSSVIRPLTTPPHDQNDGRAGEPTNRDGTRSTAAQRARGAGSSRSSTNTKGTRATKGAA